MTTERMQKSLSEWVNPRPKRRLVDAVYDGLALYRKARQLLKYTPYGGDAR